MGMSADRSAYFADANALPCLSETFFRAPEFIEHERKLQSKCDRLRVHPVTSPNHRSHFEPARLICDGRTEFFKVVE